MIRKIIFASFMCGLMTACHDYAYYDAPRPPVTVTPSYPSGSYAHYGPPVSESNAYYGSTVQTSVPPVTVTSRSNAHYGY